MASGRWGALLLATLIVGSGAAQIPIPNGKSYEIVAPLLSVKSGPTYACDMILTSLPPAGCSGVPVYRANIGQVPGVHRYWNGTMETPSMRLVGIWSGLALTLTQLPEPARDASSEPDLPCANTSPATESNLLALQQRVVEDQRAQRQHGVLVMAVGPCGESLALLVAVADDQVRSYLRSTYGPVEVSGWLMPAPA
jgi:hypothetical protein